MINPPLSDTVTVHTEGMQAVGIEIGRAISTELKRPEGLFYLQDFLDEIARADARYFTRMFEEEERTSNESKKIRLQGLPLDQEQVA